MKGETNISTDDSRAAHEGAWNAMQYANRIATTKSLPPWERVVQRINTLIIGPSIVPEHRRAFAGQYRKTNAYILGAGVETSPWLQLGEDMFLYGSQMDERIKKTKRGAENIGTFLDTIAWAHYELVKIHPFIDGNGRTARQGMDLLSKHFGVKSIILGPVHKNGYFSALERVNQSGNLDHLTLFLAAQLWKEYIRSPKPEDQAYAFYIKQKVTELNLNIYAKSKPARR